MARDKQVGENQYEVADFLLSLPQLTCVVAFSNEEGRVVERTGITTKEWDAQAISSVQFALTAGPQERRCLLPTDFDHRHSG